MPAFDKLGTLESAWHSKKKKISLFCTSVGRQSENRELRKIAEKLRKIAENCEKLRKIAKNCEIAENCEKLRTSIFPPLCLWRAERRMEPSGPRKMWCAVQWKRQGGPQGGEKIKVFENCSVAKTPRVAHMFNHGWWRLAVGD